MSFEPLWGIEDGKLRMHVPELDAIRRGLLEVIPPSALSCLSCQSLGVLWDGLPLTPELLRSRTAVRFTLAPTPSAEPEPGMVSGLYQDDEEEQDASSVWSGDEPDVPALSDEDAAPCAETERLFWEALGVLSLESEGRGWLEGLLCLWTGSGRLPGSEVVDRTSKVADSASTFGPTSHTAAVTSEEPKQTLELRIQRLRDGMSTQGRPLPRAVTCDQRLDLVSWPGETLEQLVGALKTAITHGAVGFAYE
jgi:hypothetical protein